MSKVEENLYIGDLHDAKNKSFDVIINLSGYDLFFKDVKNGNSLIFNIPMIDDDKFLIHKYFDYTFCIIELSLMKNYKTLINCYKGISRSASILINYLMKKNNWDYDEAYDYIFEKRDIINPNDGFERQLIKFK